MPEVICTASYDRLTIFLRSILKRYQEKNPHISFFDFDSREIHYEKFVRSNSLPKNIMMVFGGHGDERSLLVKDSVFYNEQYFEHGPKLLIAFACLSGLNLGHQFARETQGSFFGYDNLIDFIDKPEYQEFIERIMHPIISIISAEQEVNEDIIDRIKNIYRDVIEDLEQGAASFHEHSRFLVMFLREHLEGVCGY